ncbi:hypothetical protein C8J56DRAFT_1172610 [Mycena floridula]|nr:hypothetical protein C8J56DRAFT_1172610 [Mycena floridula]
MPLQLVRLFRRKNHRAANAATSNISELAGTSNSDSNDAQPGAFTPSLNGANIGTIHGSLFSHNQIHHHHHHHPQADDDADYAEIKVREIILETELRSGDIHHDLQSDGTLVEVGRIRKYIGRLFQHPHGSMLIHKYEGLATTDWKRHFDVLSAVRHPNIIQLYGLCRSSNFTALAFHNAQRNGVFEYHLSLSGPSFVTYLADVIDQLQANILVPPCCLKLTRIQSAANALLGHSLKPYTSHILHHNVDYAGQPVVDTFEPARGPFTPYFAPMAFASDLKALASIFKDQLLTRSSLVEYYDLLGLGCSVHGRSLSAIKNVSITHKGITTKLCPLLPYLVRLRWDSQQIPLKLEFISDMLRWTFPISQVQDFSDDMLIEVQTQKSSGHGSSPLFRVWASQIHHIIQKMKMDPSEVLTVMPYFIDFQCGAIKPSTPLPYDCLYLWHDLNHPDRKNHWWSTDPEGQISVSTTVVEGASDIRFHVFPISYHIPQQIYTILWDIHKACGFDPESTEMAEYLGYPLLQPIADSESVSHGFGPSQEADQSGYESEVESDDGSSSSHETFVSAFSED